MTVLAFVIIGLIALVQWNNTESSNDFLNEEFVELEEHFDRRKQSNTKVSKAGVAWHLDHTLKTINQLSKALMTSDPNTYHSSFSIQRTVVFTTGIIPRGAAQASQSVRPPDEILLDSLKSQLAQAKKNIESIHSLDKNANFQHSVFKQLNRDQTRRLLDIHTNHHLKIIRDILGE